jgi:hypothetical protein
MVVAPSVRSYGMGVGNLVPEEIQQSPWAAAMATAARVAFLVSSSNLSSIAKGAGGPNLNLI